MADNLVLYDSFRAVPETAKKEIKGGRLNGKTDINPMWRIKALTERFGPCGIGWWYAIQSKRLEAGADGEVAAFVDILLFYKWQGEVSEPIPGTGGSAFVAKEKAGLYTSDECYKMALTDALSVACKALGIGADVYWQKDSTKYDRRPQEAAPPKQEVTRKGWLLSLIPGVFKDSADMSAWVIGYLNKAQLPNVDELTPAQWATMKKLAQEQSHGNT